MFFISKILRNPAIRSFPASKQFSFPSNALQTKFLFSSNEGEDFKDRDKAEFELYKAERLLHWKYKKIRDGWQKPLEKKRLRKQRLAEIPKIVAPDEPQKLVIHNPAAGIELPPKENQIFAVLEIAGFQFKVVADDQVVCERLDFDINEHIVFDRVLMVGTKDYTSIGRPYVETAKVQDFFYWEVPIDIKVYATVEEQCLSEKVIVFKKRRRKHYKRTAGAKQQLTVIRIDKIDHVLEENVLQKAVALV